MRSARPKIFLLCLFLGGLLLATRAFALEDQTFKNDLSEMRTRLTALEKKQDEIIAKEDKILEEIAILKIWVHRK